MRIVPQPGILDIRAYVGGEAGADASGAVRLASNENALGCSPLARQAYLDASKELNRYPDGASTALREAIGAAHGLDPAKIVCGAGSDELISLLAAAYAGPGDEILYSAHGFLMYAINAKAVGARPVAAPEVGLRADVDALLAHVSDATRIVFLANPNNPTGSYLSTDELERLHADLPDTTLLVVDAAYAEYVALNDYPDGSALVRAASNVVMLRTFSKIHGLAGLRLGWAYGPTHVIDVLNRVRGPFNVMSAAQRAGVAAINDGDYVRASRDHNQTWRQWTADRLTALGLVVHPSVGNFVLVDFAGRADAERVRLDLKSRDVLVRQMGAYGLPTCLRLSIGTAQDMQVTAAILAEILDFHASD